MEKCFSRLALDIIRKVRRVPLFRGWHGRSPKRGLPVVNAAWWRPPRGAGAPGVLQRLLCDPVPKRCQRTAHPAPLRHDLQAVFNYEFDSLTHDDPVIQVGREIWRSRNQATCDLAIWIWGSPSHIHTHTRSGTKLTQSHALPTLSTARPCTPRCAPQHTLKHAHTYTHIIIHKLVHTRTHIPQAVYTTLREAEYRSTAPIAYWNLPPARWLVPRQRRVQEALKVRMGMRVRARAHVQFFLRHGGRAGSGLLVGRGVAAAARAGGAQGASVQAHANTHSYSHAQTS